MGTVLVVEDDDDIRYMLSMLLEQAGYRVDQARSGDEALEYLHRPDRAPCIVLLDLMMPRIDGWQVLEILQHEDRLLTIPVVVVSAVTTAKPLPPGVRMLKKPVGAKALLDAIRECCGPPS